MSKLKIRNHKNDLENFNINKTYIELTRKVYRHTPAGAGGGIVLAFITALAFMHAGINDVKLIIWGVLLAANYLISFVLYGLYKYCKPTDDKIIQWSYYILSSLTSFGVTWGLSAFLLLPKIDPIMASFLILTLIAVTTAFVQGTIGFTKTAIAIALLTLSPITIITLLSNNFIISLMGLVSILVTIFTIVSASLNSAVQKDAILKKYEINDKNKELFELNNSLELRVRDRTAELEESLKLITHQATHDHLTELPNTRLLLDYVKSSIKYANQMNHKFVVVFFSINELEKINDGLGHQVGERVIQVVSQRFQDFFGRERTADFSMTRYTTTISRKDVLVILIEPIQELEEIESKTEVLLSTLTEPVSVANRTIKLTASMGVSLYPRDGTTAKTLLMNADAAMVVAKQVGGNSLKVYHLEINAELTKQIEMASFLHEAVKNNEFILQYQPFVDLKTGIICGAEALVRWEHPILGLISPMNFIPLAEANGIIVPLGEWVLRTACIQTKQWRQQGFDFKISVNLSAKQLQQKNIVQMIASVLHEIGLPPQALELELTETEAFKEDVVPILKEIKALGVGLSIDDFGTGFSGLSNLKMIAIDKLKIDKTFTQDIGDENSNTIVANIIALGKRLGVTVLAEGVETVEQLMFLRQNDCDVMQGYYFSRPINEDIFTNLLTTKKSLDFKSLDLE